MLSQTAEYALRAAVAVAMRQPESPTHDQLAAATGIPPQYLYKVLQFLSRASVVRIHRGRAGGYTLARPAHTISYLEVLRAVDDRPPSADLPHSAAVAVARFESSLAAATLADATRAND